MLTCHAWALCTFFSARSVFFSSCCFNKLPLCASFIESAARCCRCRWLPQLQLRLTCIQCGLKAANFSSGQGAGQATRNWDAAASVSMSTLPVRASLSLCALHCVLLFFLAFFRLLNGAEIAKSFKKTVCNVLDNLPACQDYQMDVKVNQIARISNEINVSCITLPTFERVKEFLYFGLLSCISLPTFEWLLKTPAAAAANRSANSRHISQHLQATFCLWLMLISPCTLPACCLY